MKGFVLKEFITMVESAFGDEVLKKITESRGFKTSELYAPSVNYHYDELLQMLGNLNRVTGTPVPLMMKVFGKHLARVFVSEFPRIFLSAQDVFSLLTLLDGRLQKEIRRFHPDAELPDFNVEDPSSEKFILNYSSNRPFADLAEGLILGLIEHYNEKIQLSSSDSAEEKGTLRRFTLTRIGATGE